jgi:hypothetical protein
MQLKSIFLAFYIAFTVDFRVDALLPDVLFRHPRGCLTVMYNAVLWVWLCLFSNSKDLHGHLNGSYNDYVSVLKKSAK